MEFNHLPFTQWGKESEREKKKKVGTNPVEALPPFKMDPGPMEREKKKLEKPCIRSMQCPQATQQRSAVAV